MKTKILPISLVLLILLNGALIFILMKNPHQRKNERPERIFLTKQLDFSETQHKKFNQLDKIHRNNMMRINHQIREQKDILFNSFTNKNINIDSLTSKIGTLEAKKDAEIFRFFSEVRSMCSLQQVTKFDNVIKKALKGGRPRPPKHDRMPPPVDRERKHPPR